MAIRLLTTLEEAEREFPGQVLQPFAEMHAEAARAARLEGKRPVSSVEYRSPTSIGVFSVLHGTHQSFKALLDTDRPVHSPAFEPMLERLAQRQGVARMILVDTPITEQLATLQDRYGEVLRIAMGANHGDRPIQNSIVGDERRAFTWKTQPHDDGDGTLDLDHALVELPSGNFNYVWNRLMGEDLDPKPVQFMKKLFSWRPFRRS